MLSVLVVMAGRDTADPAAGDVRADDGVPPAGLLLIGGQVAHLPTGRPGPAGDPAQPAGPVPGAAEQVRDLRDVLVRLAEYQAGDRTVI